MNKAMSFRDFEGALAAFDAFFGWTFKVPAIEKWKLIISFKLTFTAIMVNSTNSHPTLAKSLKTTKIGAAKVPIFYVNPMLIRMHVQSNLQTFNLPTARFCAIIVYGGI